MQPQVVCKIPLLARRTRPKGRPSAACDYRVSCIQSRKAKRFAGCIGFVQPLGRVRRDFGAKSGMRRISSRASKGILHAYKDSICSKKLFKIQKHRIRILFGGLEKYLDKLKTSARTRPFETQRLGAELFCKNIPNLCLTNLGFWLFKICLITKSVWKP